MGQVPCLLVNQNPMVESNSVLRFIADRFNLSSLYPKDFKQWHEVDVMLDFCNTVFRPPLSAANVGVFYGPVLYKAKWLTAS